MQKFNGRIHAVVERSGDFRVSAVHWRNGRYRRIWHDQPFCQNNHLGFSPSLSSQKDACGDGYGMTSGAHISMGITSEAIQNGGMETAATI